MTPTQPTDATSTSKTCANRQDSSNRGTARFKKQRHHATRASKSPNAREHMTIAQHSRMTCTLLLLASTLCIAIAHTQKHNSRKGTPEQLGITHGNEGKPRKQMAPPDTMRNHEQPRMPKLNNMQTYMTGGKTHHQGSARPSRGSTTDSCLYFQIKQRRGSFWQRHCWQTSAGLRTKFHGLSQVRPSGWRHVPLHWLGFKLNSGSFVLSFGVL